MRFLVISLLSILAGTLLLAKTRKEALGKFFTCTSWFFIVVGFILFIGFLGGGIYRMTHHGWIRHPGFRQEMMMKRPEPGMHKGMYYPGDKFKGMGDAKMNCMKHDSTMKSCPMHHEGDTAKMIPPKTK